MRQVLVSFVGRDGRGSECTLTPAGIFCPRCGSPAVWRRGAATDRELRQLHLCVRCEATFCFTGFTLPGEHAALDKETQRACRAITSCDEVPPRKDVCGSR